MWGTGKPPASLEWMWCADVGDPCTSFSSILFLLASNPSSLPFIPARRISQFKLWGEEITCWNILKILCNTKLDLEGLETNVTQV